MQKGIFRFIAPLLFIITGVMALMQERDYWEAASWFSFAIAVSIFAFKPTTGPGNKNARMAAYFFMALGVILLVLRLLGVLPEPVRPLP